MAAEMNLQLCYCLHLHIYQFRMQCAHDQRIVSSDHKEIFQLLKFWFTLIQKQESIILQTPLDL